MIIHTIILLNPVLQTQVKF